MVVSVGHGGSHLNPWRILPRALLGGATAHRRAAARRTSVLVLIVEDHRDAREMVEELLRFAGFRTATAVDGFEAVEKATNLKPAAILMDLALPGLNGWEATRQLKADPRTRDIPVIALTAQALRDQETEAWEAGCEGFLTKPALPPEILHELCRVLDPRRPRKR